MKATHLLMSILGVWEFIVGIVVTVIGGVVYKNCLVKFPAKLGVYVGPLIMLHGLLTWSFVYVKFRLRLAFCIFSGVVTVAATIAAINGAIGLRCQYEDKNFEGSDLSTCNYMKPYIASDCKLTPEQQRAQRNATVDYLYAVQMQAAFFCTSLVELIIIIVLTSIALVKVRVTKPQRKPIDTTIPEKELSLSVSDQSLTTSSTEYECYDETSSSWNKLSPSSSEETENS